MKVKTTYLTGTGHENINTVDLQTTYNIEKMRSTRKLGEKE